MVRYLFSMGRWIGGRFGTLRTGERRGTTCAVLCTYLPIIVPQPSLLEQPERAAKEAGRYLALAGLLEKTQVLL